MNETGGKREQIITEATRLFVTRGYDGISMREIAETVDVSKAAIYYHFKDKEDLFLAVLRANLEHTSAIVAHARQQGGSARQQLTLMLHGIAAQTPEQRAIVRLASQDMDRIGAQARAAFSQTYQHSFIGQIQDILREGMSRREVKAIDVRLATWILLGMAYPFFSSAQGHEPGQTAAAIDMIIAIFFDGISA
jgi:AcrR family transcriptional regulator